jgi:hypothetical protein
MLPRYGSEPHCRGILPLFLQLGNALFSSNSYHAFGKEQSDKTESERSPFMEQQREPTTQHEANAEAEAWYQQGLALYQQQRLVEAVVAFEKARDSKPDEKRYRDAAVETGRELRLSRLQAGRFLLARPLFAVPSGEAALF